MMARKSETVPIVFGLTFVCQHPTSGGYSVYAWVEDAWRLYDHHEVPEDAIRLAKKYARRLKQAATRGVPVHDTGKAMER